MWVDREALNESAKECELCAVFSKLVPAEEPHEIRFTYGQRISDREIHIHAAQKLSDDGSFYNVEIEFTRHTYMPSPLTLANVTICNNPG